MNITSIKIDGFGGLSQFSSPISPITVITGPNGSGKTSILDGIAIGLIGYCPALGNKPSLTRGRMHKKLASVRLELNGGDAVTETTFPPTGNPVTIKNGDVPVVDPMVLDIGKFFSMTGPQRVQFLTSLSVGGVPQAAEVQEELYATTFAKHGVPLTKWSEMVKPIFEKFLGNQTNLEWLTALKAEATLRKNEVGGLGGLKELAMKLESEAVPKEGESVPMDHSADLRKLERQLTEARAKHLADSEVVNRLTTQISTYQREAADLRRKSQDTPSKKCSQCGSVITGAVKSQTVKDSLLGNAAEREKLATDLIPQRDAALLVVAESKAAVDMLQVQKTGVDMLQRAYTMSLGASLQLDKIRLQIQELEEKAEVLSAIPGWVGKYQAAIVDRSMEPICTMASQIVQSRFNCSVAISGGDFVISRNGALVSLDCASGGERLLATVGIQVALMQNAPFKLVLVDELGRADNDSVNHLLAIVSKLVEKGVIDQFVAARPELDLSDADFGEHFSTIDL